MEKFREQDPATKVADAPAGSAYVALAGARPSEEMKGDWPAMKLCCPD